MYLGLRLSGLDTQTLLDQLPSEWTARFGGSEGGKLPGWATDYVDPTVFGVAFILSKVLVPLKLMVVVWATPKVARAWSRLGAAKAGVAVVAVEGQAVEAKEE